jgi:hypothetical protein
MPPAEQKVCATCGRRFAWRRRWARTWDAVRYCSAACRRRPTAIDAALEAAILALLAARGRDASICPSEAARCVGGADWRSLMERSRRAARRLVARDAVQITQGGRVFDAAPARGPIRLRAVPPAR